MHDAQNEECPLNDPETFANPATRGLQCCCPAHEMPTTFAFHLLRGDFGAVKSCLEKAIDSAQGDPSLDRAREYLKRTCDQIDEELRSKP